MAQEGVCTPYVPRKTFKMPSNVILIIRLSSLPCPSRSCSFQQPPSTFSKSPSSTSVRRRYRQKLAGLKAGDQFLDVPERPCGATYSLRALSSLRYSLSRSSATVPW